MESFKQFVEARGPSGKTQLMIDLVHAIKNCLKNYNPDTRKSVWKKLTSSKGQQQMDRLLRNPDAPISQSDFNKLVQSNST